MILYHGSKAIIKFPEVRKAEFNQVFLLDFVVLRIGSRRNDGQYDMEK